VADIQTSVLTGKIHRYRAIGGTRTATVTARAGTGRILYPYQSITVGGGSRRATGTTVWVYGVTRCTYVFVGSFYGPYPS
jgi:hypothetical protein